MRNNSVELSLGHMKAFSPKTFFCAISAAFLCSCANLPKPDHNASSTATEESQFSPAEALSWVAYAPKPQYPLEARRLWLTGSGIYRLRIQIRSGRVKEVTVSRSTGWAILDYAAINTLKEWRFKPGAPPPIRVILPHRKDPFAAEDSLMNVPINFSMSR